MRVELEPGVRWSRGSMGGAGAPHSHFHWEQKRKKRRKKKKERKKRNKRKTATQSRSITFLQIHQSQLTELTYELFLHSLHSLSLIFTLLRLPHLSPYIAVLYHTHSLLTTKCVQFYSFRSYLSDFHLCLS